MLTECNGSLAKLYSVLSKKRPIHVLMYHLNRVWIHPWNNSLHNNACVLDLFLFLFPYLSFNVDIVYRYRYIHIYIYCKMILDIYLLNNMCLLPPMKTCYLSQFGRICSFCIFNFYFQKMNRLLAFLKKESYFIHFCSVLLMNLCLFVPKKIKKAKPC